MKDIDFAKEIINDLKEDFKNSPKIKEHTISFTDATENNTDLELVRKEIEKEFNLKIDGEFWTISQKSK